MPVGSSGEAFHLSFESLAAMVHIAEARRSDRVPYPSSTLLNILAGL